MILFDRCNSCGKYNFVKKRAYKIPYSKDIITSKNKLCTGCAKNIAVMLLNKEIWKDTIPFWRIDLLCSIGYKIIMKQLIITAHTFHYPNLSMEGFKIIK